MAMAILYRLSFAVFLTLLLVELTVSVDPPEISPSPVPSLAGDSPSPLSPPPDAGAPSSPSPSSEFSSPPAPPPSDLAPGSSPTPSPMNSPTKASPAPALTSASDIYREKSNVTADPDELKESSGGLKGGQKAGIVLGVVAGACIVGLAGLLYKKRQNNIRRSQYGYAARREIL